MGLPTLWGEGLGVDGKDGKSNVILGLSQLSLVFRTRRNKKAPDGGGVV